MTQNVIGTIIVLYVALHLQKSSIDCGRGKVCGAPISWQSQRQPSISHSSCEAEYIAANEATREGVYLKDFFNEMYIPGLPKIETMSLYTDNQSAIKLTKNPEFHSRVKHIRRKFHYIREVVDSKDINPIWIRSADNVADILTKPLQRIVFERLREKAGIHASMSKHSTA